MNVLNIKCKKSESRDISIIKKPLNKTLKSQNGNITKTNIYKSCRAKNGISDIYTSFFDCGNAKYKKKTKNTIPVQTKEAMNGSTERRFLPTTPTS